MKILLGDFNAKVGKDNIFKPTIRRESLQQDNNDNGVKIVNVAKTKSLVVKSTMFQQRIILKHIWTPPDEKPHNHIELMLMDRSWDSSILDVRSFKGADCVNDQ
jgi:hypothetical protein